MLAARQVIGVPSITSHYFCTFCDLDINDIHILDPDQWPAKDIEHLRQKSRLWKDTTKARAHTRIYEKYGIRWSSLHDLPYWDFVRFTIMDSMHALDLNLFQNHCRIFFKLDIKVASGNELSYDPVLPTPWVLSSKAVRRCRTLIYQNDDDLLDKLMDFPRPVLHRVCTEHQILLEGRSLVLGTSWVLARSIWDRPQSMSEEELATLESNGGEEGGEEEDGLEEKEDNRDDKDGEVDEDGDDDNKGDDDNDNDNDNDDNDNDDDNDDDDNDDDDDDDDEEGEGNKEGLGDDNVFVRRHSPQLLPRAQGVNLKKTAAIIKVLVGESDDKEEEMTKAYKAGSATIFKYLLDLLSIDHSNIPDNRRMAKRQCWDILVGKIANEEYRQQLSTFVARREASNKRVVLGRDVMKTVWEDMTRTQLPSWISPAPSQWGTAQRGKLSADQWRVICTIHLPITLIRLWGTDTGRWKELFDNFMDLVATVRIANMRISSPAQSAAFKTHILRYLRQLTNLYPDEHLRPSHHIAIHIGDMLDFFGPVHSHREVEATLLHTSIRNANLRAILADDTTTRTTVIEMVDKMQSIAQENA
ncbi:hypothetical protein AX16_001997 [Volvariella volvacea WC 439]|nr:hypothetical protein AX16_001997 [Volvariella volvacea WC 439]